MSLTHTRGAARDGRISTESQREQPGKSTSALGLRNKLSALQKRTQAHTQAQLEVTGQNQRRHLGRWATLISVVTFVESIVSVRPTAVAVCVSVLFQKEKPQGTKLDGAPRRDAEDKNLTAQDRATFTTDLNSVFLSQHTHTHVTS